MAGRPAKDSGILSKKEVLSNMHKNKVINLEKLLTDGERNSDYFKEVQKLFTEHDATGRKASDSEVKNAYEYETGKLFPNREKAKSRKTASTDMSIESALTLIKSIEQFPRVKELIGELEELTEKAGGISEVSKAIALEEKFFGDKFKAKDEEIAALKQQLELLQQEAKSKKKH